MLGLPVFNLPTRQTVNSSQAPALGWSSWFSFTALLFNYFKTAGLSGPNQVVDTHLGPLSQHGCLPWKTWRGSSRLPNHWCVHAVGRWGDGRGWEKHRTFLEPVSQPSHYIKAAGQQQAQVSDARRQRCISCFSFFRSNRCACSFQKAFLWINVPLWKALFPPPINVA